MFCTTIIPTIGRESLERTVNSVLSQAFDCDSAESTTPYTPQFEIIVVNDTGKRLTPAKWQNAPNLRVVTTDRNFQSTARNVGAALARGKYLHFLDDDDWLLPNALQQLWQVAERTDAGWIYGGAQLVDKSGNELPVIDLGIEGNCFTPIMAGEWVPMGSYIIKRSVFFEAHGFDPRFTPGEDITFCRHVARTTQFARVAATVVALDRGEHTTTHYADARLRSREGREQILNLPKVHVGLRDSAESQDQSTNTPYWHARLLRIYLVSAAWNIQQRRPIQAALRILSALRSLLWSSAVLTDRRFWRSLRGSHMSNTRTGTP